MRWDSARKIHFLANSLELFNCKDSLKKLLEADFAIFLTKPMHKSKRWGTALHLCDK